MLDNKVWENENYRISITDERATLINKENGEVITDTITCGTKNEMMAILKKMLVLHEIGNHVDDVLWENETYILKFGWGRNKVDLKNKLEDETLAEFKLDSPNGLNLIRKVIAFL